MAKSSTASAAFGLCVGLLVLSLTFACNCKVKHPQTQYKEANFVVKGKVLSKYRDQADEESSYGVSYLEYQVKISKIFKGRKYLNSNVVTMKTPDGHSCGIKSMKPGKNYLISGHHEDGVFTLNVCSWVEMWSALTREQKRGLKSTYAVNCRKCDVPSVSGPELVMTLVDPRAPQTVQLHNRKLFSLSGLWATESGSCTYNPVDSWQFPATMDCETRFTYCSEGPQDRKCRWEITDNYKDCFIDRETAWAKREVLQTTLVGRAGTTRLGNRLLGCSVEDEANFDACLRDEVEKIVTQFL